MKKSATVLTDFQIIKPPFEKPQSELVEWTSQCHLYSHPHHADRIRKFFRKYAVPPESISYRSFECPDILTPERWDKNKIYQILPHQSEGVDIRERAGFFSERAQVVFAKFYENIRTRPNHLIHVTCTGYVSPSAAQMLLAQSDWSASSAPTALTHAYHMGCYAALPASRMADMFVRASSDPYVVDIVHTEMCGLHMNAAENTPEQIILQTLFADGHVKYSAVPVNTAESGLKILGFCEWIVPDSANDMSWMPSSWGMQMTLSRNVPEKICQALHWFLQKLSDMVGTTLRELLKTSIFAVHPGGPKIIEMVKNTLELSKEQTAASVKILYERGNMSSATLPHVWNEILTSAPVSGTRLVSLAFGPGLTLFGAVFECL